MSVHVATTASVTTNDRVRAEEFEITDQPRLMTLDPGTMQALGGFKGKGKVRFGNSLHAGGVPTK